MRSTAERWLHGAIESRQVAKESTSNALRALARIATCNQRSAVLRICVVLLASRGVPSFRDRGSALLPRPHSCASDNRP